MAVSEFYAAIKQVAAERGIPEESVFASIRAALATAYRKDYGGDLEEIVVDLDEQTGEARILQDGVDVTPAGFGRIAAQTAKQVILQKIRETEKEVIMDEFKAKIGEIMVGHIFRLEPTIAILDLGKAQGVMPISEQVSSETYRMNQRIKVLIKDVRLTQRGTEIIVSRSDADFVRKLFEQEVPELSTGTVKIEAIAREAGSRTKMAVSTTDEKIDPVGSCVGQKGVRVQAIISELFGEKIDIVPYSPDVSKYIASSLSPAKVYEVELFEEEKRALVSVPEDQQSLAIGKEGQNARLANKLTKWKIDIKGASGLFGAATTEVKTVDTSSARFGIWDAAIKEQQAASDSSQDDVVADDSVDTPTDDVATDDTPITDAANTENNTIDTSEE
ncbi:transcription termination/antitermination protein NusA [candidate division WWE3 bacterium]|uniref:Transcription termination/antitermination protein NusA n=1 Tax=candidate division WWE3 bacterium TaxID=2053526 RepID=A0A955ED81_UNCKA|nr:transcription termination/antitermination protein NusA [candidate division WWE3 bacterium]